MAAHSSVLAWRVPSTEEPGGLQSMGSQGSDMTELLTLLLFRGGETRGTSEGDQERTTLR